MMQVLQRFSANALYFMQKDLEKQLSFIKICDIS